MVRVLISTSSGVAFIDFDRRDVHATVFIRYFSDRA